MGKRMVRICTTYACVVSIEVTVEGAVKVMTGSPASTIVVDVVVVVERVEVPDSTEILIEVLVVIAVEVTVRVDIFKRVEQNPDAEGTALKADKTRDTILHSEGATALSSMMAAALTAGILSRRLESNIPIVPTRLVRRRRSRFGVKLETLHGLCVFLCSIKSGSSSNYSYPRNRLSTCSPGLKACPP